MTEFVNLRNWGKFNWIRRTGDWFVWICLLIVGLIGFVCSGGNASWLADE